MKKKRQPTKTQKRTTVFLTDDQQTRLEQEQEKTGAPMAEIIRRAIDAYFNNKEERNA